MAGGDLGDERGVAGAAAMQGPRPGPYLHVELSPGGGGLHHPVHHTDQGFALAHLRQTGEESAERSAGTRWVTSERLSPGALRASGCRMPPPRDVPGARAVRGQLPRVLLLPFVHSRASWAGCMPWKLY